MLVNSRHQEIEDYHQEHITLIRVDYQHIGIVVHLKEVRFMGLYIVLRMN